MQNIIEVTEDRFEPEVMQANLPVLVDFYAPWCGPCRMLAPVLDQFAADFAGKIKFAKVNVDHLFQLATEYEITGVPTLMLFAGGRPVGRQVGFPAPRELKSWLEQTIAKTAPV